MFGQKTKQKVTKVKGRFTHNKFWNLSDSVVNEKKFLLSGLKYQKSFSNQSVIFQNFFEKTNLFFFSISVLYENKFPLINSA